MTLQESLDRHEISGRIREEVLRPFFRLVFADEDLRTSYQFAMLEHAGAARRACRPCPRSACRRCPTSSRWASSSPSSTAST